MLYSLQWFYDAITCLVLLLLLPLHRSLEGDEFVKRVVPTLSRLFTSSDRNLRRNLLESIDTYGQHLTTVRNPPPHQAADMSAA